MENPTSQRLYHEFAKEMPIIDYHCHLSPADMANNRQFKTLTEIWLEGDHYKWRAMRTNGVPENTVPVMRMIIKSLKNGPKRFYTIRNPLYHWTHMELKRPFGVNKILAQQLQGTFTIPVMNCWLPKIFSLVRFLPE
ncbi:MAG: glucuronate isomerase [Bacteroidia bacterium]